MLRRGGRELFDDMEKGAPEITDIIDGIDIGHAKCVNGGQSPCCDGA